MSIRRIRLLVGVVFAGLVVGLVGESRVEAGTLVLSNPFGPTINVNFRGTEEQTGTGSITSTLDGKSLPWLYCVEIDRNINVPGTYDTPFRTDGIVHGNLLAHAGGVAWLVDHFAASAVSLDQQGGLQAAIWRTIYGSDFKLYGVDITGTGTGTNANTTAIKNNYTADLTALGANVDPLSNVRWLSPTAVGDPTSLVQGLVTSAAAVPEPATFALAAVGAAGALVVARRKRSSR